MSITKYSCKYWIEVNRKYVVTDKIIIIMSSSIIYPFSSSKLYGFSSYRAIVILSSTFPTSYGTILVEIPDARVMHKLNKASFHLFIVK